jgi:hypothetical protein
MGHRVFLLPVTPIHKRRHSVCVGIGGGAAAGARVLAEKQQSGLDGGGNVVDGVLLGYRSRSY